LRTGKFQLTRKIKLEGWRARMIGIILALPTLVQFVIWFLIRLGKIDQIEMEYFGIIYMLVILSALFYAIVFSVIANSAEDDISLVEDAASVDTPQ
jgi:hypothetical protein